MPEDIRVPVEFNGIFELRSKFHTFNAEIVRTLLKLYRKLYFWKNLRRMPTEQRLSFAHQCCLKETSEILKTCLLWLFLQYSDLGLLLRQWHQTIPFFITFNSFYRHIGTEKSKNCLRYLPWYGYIHWGI